MTKILILVAVMLLLLGGVSAMGYLTTDRLNRSAEDAYDNYASRPCGCWSWRPWRD